MTEPSPQRPSVSRRALLATGAAGAAGLAAGWAASEATAGESAAPSSRVAFHGRHQAGVTTPKQASAAVVAFDLRRGTDADALRRLFRIWTDDIERLTSGRPGLADTEPELARDPARLTVTVGVGPAAVRAAGHPVPEWLGPLPGFTIDRLQDRWNGGDLVLQVCADDSLVVAHAVRLLTKEARSFVTVRWVQRGFHGGTDPIRPRNLMGQVDGTSQPDVADQDRLVWVGPRSQEAFGAQPNWLVGGTTMVVRRIAMNLDTWDELDRGGRERAIGRRLDDGRPLTGGRLTDDPDLEAVGDDGLEVIDPFAHVRRARTGDDDQRFVRRPFNYDDPPDDGDLTNAGLVFIAFQADLRRQFLPIQRRLSELDLLNQWTTPIGSAVFAVLPGVRPGGQLGAALLA